MVTRKEIEKMKKLLMVLVASLALSGAAQEQFSTSASAAEAPQKKVAIFVQNRTRVPGMDDEIDGIRDRLAASLASVEGLVVCDSAQIADSFRRYKVTTEEERRGLISGIFSGGSVPNVARMIGCDYIIAASVIGASSMKRNMSGRLNTVFTLRMTTKIMDAAGATVGGLPNWSNTYPVIDEGGDDPMNYYNILIDGWIEDATEQIAASAPNWRKPAASAGALVSFDVKTSIDSTVAELEAQTKGVKGEDLVSLRKIVGCASVELDGAVIGSAPNTFRATPGLHQIKITREWMKPYTATVLIAEGTVLNVALEMNDEGLAKWGREESLRADLARRYAEAAALRGIKVNVDTSKWRDASFGGGVGGKVILQND